MPERAILVGLELKNRPRTPVRGPEFDASESLEELVELAVSAGGEVVEKVLQVRNAPEAATLIGSGKVEELAASVASTTADVVIFDHDLSPTQQRNLERALKTKVIDRTQLILDIFAARARTREGRLQVELAQLSYLLPRLAGRGIEMSRLGGGIGTRGPGETQLETDRRRIARRIRKLKSDLENVRAGRALHRSQRRSVPLATLALVGYTNAGKSTLFNRITTAGVLADAKMFATLDPTVRAVNLPSRRRVLLSDTVGFIRNLPTTLVEAFRATLEEVADATLILHVVDVSSPHAAEQTAHVFEVLREIEAGSIPQILVLNKIDRAGGGFDAATLAPRLLASNESPEPVPFVAASALTGHGLPELLAAIDRVLPFDPLVRIRLRVPHSESARLAAVHRLGRVLSTEYDEQGAVVEAEAPESLARTLADLVVS